MSWKRLFEPKSPGRALAVAGAAVMVLAFGFATAIGNGAGDGASSPGAAEPGAQSSSLQSAAGVTDASGPASEAMGRRKPRAPRVRGALVPTRVVVTGLVLLAACAAVAYALARVMRRTRLAPRGERVLQLIDVMPLGPKRQVFVLSAWDRKLVVAASGERVTVLAELSDEEIDRTVSAAAFEETLARRERGATRQPAAAMEAGA